MAKISKELYLQKDAEITEKFESDFFGGVTLLYVKGKKG